MALGTWSFLEESSQLSLIKVSSVKDILFNISLALTLIGCIVFSMSFAGCLGALRENLCLLKLVCINCVHCIKPVLTVSIAVLINAVNIIHRRNHTIDGGLCLSKFVVVLLERKLVQGSVTKVP